MRDSLVYGKLVFATIATSAIFAVDVWQKTKKKTTYYFVMFFLLFFLSYMSALSGGETESALKNEEYIYFPSSEEITTITNGFCGEVLVNEKIIYFPSSDEIEYFERFFFYKGRRDEIVYDMMLCNGLGKNAW